MGGIDVKQFNLDEYLENPSKKVVTRDGKNARIICTDAKNNYPIVALIETSNGKERQPCGYKKDGTYVAGEELSCDLFFAPEKHEGWINLYKDDGIVYTSMDTFKTKKEAESASCSTRIATVKIEWEE